MTLQADAKSLEQFRRNADKALNTARENGTIVLSFKTIANRASEIAIKANPITGVAAYKNYAIEINSLLEEALSQANRQTSNGYSFSGTRSDQEPYVPTRDQDNRITSVAYQGNTSVTLSNIGPGSSISATTIGSNDTNSGPPGLLTDQRSGANFFAHLIALRDNLEAGDIRSIQETDIKALEADEDNFLFHLSALGSLQSRIETTQARLSDRSLAVATETSYITDADLAETIVSLNQAQTAYQAAIQSGAKILSISLMDYIR